MYEAARTVEVPESGAGPNAGARFCWMDLKTRDLPGTAAFFGRTLGWRFAVDESDWRRATKASADGHPVAGVSDLANPVYPPGTPAHIACYLAVDDVDGRAEAAVAHGASLVVPPFDAGDQGRVATLVDPAGAAFSLWSARGFAGWDFPPGTAGAPHGTVLACAAPERARDFYAATVGGPLAEAEFVEAPAESAPRWVPVVGVPDLEAVAARAPGHASWAQDARGPVLRLVAPDGLAVLVRPAPAHTPKD